MRDGPRGGERGALGRAALELLTLTGAAIAQPVLDEFGRAPEVFVRAGAGGLDVVLFALAVALVPPAVLWAAELGVALAAGETNRRRLHAVLCAVLVTLFAVRTLRLTTGIEARPLLVLAIAVAAAFMALVATVAALRQWLAFASPLPAVVVVLFVFSSPVHGVFATRGAAPAAAPHVTRAPTSPSVVMLVLDEFPIASLLGADGTIDRARYPGFAALADGSVWYRNTTTVADHTVYAVPAILTGRNPPSGAPAPTWASYPDNLFRLLGGAYPMRVSEVATQLCAASYCSPTSKASGHEQAAATSTPTTAAAHRDGLGGLLTRARHDYGALVSLHSRANVAPEANFGEAVGAASTTTAPPTTATTFRPGEAPPGGATVPARADYSELPAMQPARFTDLLDGIRAGEEPTFHFAHLLLPHGPWRLFPDGTEHPVPPAQLQVPGYESGKLLDDAPLAELERRRHLLQVGYADRLIGALVARLQATGVWQHSIVVVVADHGVAFTPGAGLRELDGANQPEILGVPLFVHAPALAHRVDDRPAETIDVVPTIADLLHVRIPWPVDGRSLVRPGAAPRVTHPVSKSGDFGGPSRVSTVNVSHHLEQLLALAHRRALPPAGPDPTASLLASGPHGDWLRRAVPATVAPARGSAASVTVEWPGAGALVAPIAPGAPRPLLVAGHVHGARAGDDVVFAVDGRVAAVTTVYSEHGVQRFVALLDPGVVTVGTHHVQVYVAPQGVTALDAVRSATLH